MLSLFLRSTRYTSGKMELYFATHNRNKLSEIQKLLPENIRLLSLDDLGLQEEIPETADTIAGNSLMKTQYVYDQYQVACFGDDTGLEVDALQGAPGVRSARYASEGKDSEANMDLLLKNLENAENRTARFKTVITFIAADGDTRQFTGTVEGEITHTRSGEKGFGYDPVFRPAEHDKTFAEMSPEEKNKISHRGKAFRQLINFLKA